MKNLALILLFSVLVCATPSLTYAGASFEPRGPQMPFGGGNKPPIISNYIPQNTQFAEKGKILSLREVAQIIDANVPGRISDAQLTTEGGRQVYLVRWEPSQERERGRIIIFVVDAESGRILNRRGG